MSTRHQQGYIFRKGRAWYVRYYETNAADRRIQRCRKLSEYSDRYRCKKDVRPLAEEFLRPLNEGRVGPLSTLPISEFIEHHYLPAVADRLRPSTMKGYRDIFGDHLKARLDRICLRDFRCVDGDRLLAKIARERQLSRQSVYHIKSFLSGVFKHARRQGIMDGTNPMQDAAIPSAKPPADTHAYSLEEIQGMLADLPEPARTAVATAAFTGLRKSELRGLRWEDYRDGALYVSRSVWGRHTLEPKTRYSRAAVTVIAQLADMLDVHHRGKQPGPIFCATNGRPLNLDNLTRRVIQPILATGKVCWHGWHAFRRGLATNLHRLGVDDKTIQAILRHSSVQTTREIYIKSVGADATVAMRRLEDAIRVQPRLN